MKNNSRSDLQNNHLLVPSDEVNTKGVDFRKYFGKGRLFEGAIIINLDSRPDRLERSMSELKRFGLDSFVVRMSGYKHENGMYGCSVSHLEAVYYARWKGWKSVLIFEDDIKISNEFASLAPAAFADLATLEWGLFQFGIMLQPAGIESATENLFRYTHGQAAHAFALHERTYDYLTANYICELDRGNWREPDHYPFDEYLNNQLTYEFDAFGSKKLLVSQHAGVSDTWNIRVDYRGVIEESYEKFDFDTDANGGSSTDNTFSAAPYGATSITTVGFAGSRVAIEWYQPELGELVHFLFGGISLSNSWPICAEFSVCSDVSGCYELWGDESLVYSGTCKSSLGLYLLQQVRACVVANQRKNGLILSASAIAVGAKVISLIGNSSVVAPTLLALLISKTPKCKLIGTQLVYIPEGSQRLVGFEQVLEVKRNLKPMLADASGMLKDHTNIVSSSESCLVRFKDFDPGYGHEQLPISLILFPVCQSDSRRDQGIELKRLSGADAGLRLMGALQNACGLSGNGFGEVSDLVRRTPAFELGHTRFERLGAGFGRELVRVLTDLHSDTRDDAQFNTLR